MAEWQEVRLGDLIELQRGFDLPKQKRASGSIPIVSSSGISDYHIEVKVPPPGVVTGRYGTVGQVFYLDQPFWPLNTTLWVKNFKGNDPKFVYYFLHTVDFNSCADKSSVPGVNRNDLHLLPAIIPPLSEQQAIAEVLSALDEKIELNRRMNATLEAMARALFKSWFVDFIPVRAKMEGRTPDGLSADIAAMFPDTLVDSPLGEIPKGWAVKTLADIVQLNPSERIPKDSVAPYLDMAALPTAGFFPEEPRPRKVSSGSRFKNGDTLLARITPCLENGKTAYITELEEQQIGWGSTEFIVMRPKAPCPPEYGYLLARDENFRTFAIQSMTGSSGRQRVPVEALGRYEIVTPSAPLMEKFAIFVQPMFEKSIAAMRENQTLSQLRDTLLPKLISGHLRVTDATSSIKEAV